MTNPGDSDEWWKQYGGSGVSPESGAPGSVPQYPTAQPSQPAQPSSYPSAPQYPQQPAPPPSLSKQPDYQQPVPPPSQPQYPNYQQPAGPPPGYGGYPAAGGYPGAGGYQPYGGYPQPQGTNGLAIGALVSSLIGFCSCGLGSVVGIILGVMAMNQIKERGGEGRGMAQAGIWIGVLAIVGWVLYILFFVVIGIAGGFDSSTTY
ncbi:DUF4190 domain-containing protein [Nocardia sp. NPDC059177]|uniref:DUF4190 domain-containing protein n=1 Tax=Nocardia sp. NPDC059177 TaxID=3346759 RepID=UPI0036C071D1